MWYWKAPGQVSKRYFQTTNAVCRAIEELPGHERWIDTVRIIRIPEKESDKPLNVGVEIRYSNWGSKIKVVPKLSLFTNENREETVKEWRNK